MSQLEDLAKQRKLSKEELETLKKVVEKNNKGDK